MARIGVPQADGEIVLTPGDGSEQRRYSVKDGRITVRAEDVALVLASVAGSTPEDDAARRALDSTTDTSAPAVSPTT